MGWIKLLFVCVLLMHLSNQGAEAESSSENAEITGNSTYPTSGNSSLAGNETSRKGPPVTKEKGGLKFLFRKSVLRVIPLYLTPPMILFGLIGNIMSLLVLFSFVKYQKSSSDVHLCALAVFDMGALIFAAIPFWLNAFLRDELARNNVENSIGVFINTYGACQTIFFISGTFKYCAVWMIVIFTIERYWFVSHPFTASEKFTVKRAFISTGFLVLVSMALTMYKFWAFEKNITPTGNFCKWGTMYFIGSFIEKPLQSLVPGLLVAIFNILMIRQLVFHRKDDARVVPGKEREKQVTHRVLAVSITFLVLTLPFMIMSIWRNIVVLQMRARKGTIEQLSQGASEFFAISQFMFVCNHCINFLLYFCTGSRFRVAFRLLVKGQLWSSITSDGSNLGTPKSTRSSLLDINNAKDNPAEINTLLVKALHNRRKSLEKVNAV